MSSNLKTIVEALLFVADSPMTTAQLAQVMETGDKAKLEAALEDLASEYDVLGHAFELVKVAGGWRMRTRPEMAVWLRKLVKQQATRLSPAALETLAVVAYKQPVLKAEVDRMRGVDTGGVLRALMEKGLVRVLGRKDLPGNPLIYGTTRRFLEVFDLNSLDDLPSLKEMESLVNELEVAVEESGAEGPAAVEQEGQGQEEADEAAFYDPEKIIEDWDEPQAEEVEGQAEIEPSPEQDAPTEPSPEPGREAAEADEPEAEDPGQPPSGQHVKFSN